MKRAPPSPANAIWVLTGTSASPVERSMKASRTAVIAVDIDSARSTSAAERNRILELIGG